MGLRIYDAVADETREVTQGDVEELVIIRASHQRMLAFLADERARVMTEILAAREKHDKAAE